MNRLVCAAAALAFAATFAGCRCSDDGGGTGGAGGGAGGPTGGAGGSDGGTATPLPYRGVNLAGAEFAMDAWGGGQNPGVFLQDYVWPDPTYWRTYQSADYYLAKGVTTFRVPFRWERLQPRRGQPFDDAELERLTTTVRNLTGKGAHVVIDVHNYARYGRDVIGPDVPVQDFADLWARLAGIFKDDPKVIFGLMNEPHDVRTEHIVEAANAALAAIRKVDARQLVLVSGNHWDSAQHWAADFYGTPNARAMLDVHDPLNNVAFEVHQYFDGAEAGGLGECASPTYGAEAMASFTNWLREHGKKGFVGEFGAQNSWTCRAAVDNFLRHLEENRDVYLGWTAWAGGPWWGDYPMLLEPVEGVDRPIFDVLECHLGGIETPCPAVGEPGSGGSGGGGATGGTGGAPDGGPGPGAEYPEGTSENAFWVGHSLVNLNMPWMVRDIAREKGILFEYRAQVNNGTSLKGNWENPTRWNPIPVWTPELGRDVEWGANSHLALGTGLFDFLVLTESVPLALQIAHNDSVQVAGNYLELAVRHRSDIRPYLYQTWDFVPDGNDYAAWRALLTENQPTWEQYVDAINAAHDGPDVRLIPGGPALAALYDRLQVGPVGEITSMAQIFEDDIHLLPIGNYLIALVQFSTFFGQSPVGTGPVRGGPFQQHRMVAEHDATRAALQQLAWEVVSDSPRAGLRRR